MFSTGVVILSIPYLLVTRLALTLLNTLLNSCLGADSILELSLTDLRNPPKK